jgi:hypothetical protein
MPELCIIFKYKERNKIRKLANLFQKKTAVCSSHSHRVSLLQYNGFKCSRLKIPNSFLLLQQSVFLIRLVQSICLIHLRRFRRLMTNGFRVGAQLRRRNDRVVAVQNTHKLCWLKLCKI